MEEFNMEKVVKEGNAPNGPIVLHCSAGLYKPSHSLAICAWHTLQTLALECI